MAMTKSEKQEMERLVAENAQLHAANNELSIKLKGQIARGNRIKMRKTGEAETSAPESPTFMAAARAYCAANPGKPATRDAVTEWVKGRVLTPA